MHSIRAIALYEFRMQRRGLSFWLIGVLALAFLLGQVLPGNGRDALLATSSEPVLRTLQSPGGPIEVDLAALAQQALERDSFSAYQAWRFIDLVGLSMALLIGFAGAFVWQRDRRRELEAIINVRPPASWQYVLGKYLGLLLSWGLIFGLLLLIGGLHSAWVAQRFGLFFSWPDFLVPALAGVGITLLYGSAVILALSLLLGNPIAALLLYFVYWLSCMVQTGMFAEAGNIQLLSNWLWRSTAGMTPTAYETLQQRMELLAWNRLLYLLLSAALLGLMSLMYQQRRRGRAFSLRPGLRFIPVRAMRDAPSKRQQPALHPGLALIGYQARLIWRVNLWLAPLAGLMIPWFVFMPADLGDPAYWPLRTAETFAPLIGVLVCANLLAQEWERGMAELWLSKALPRRQVLLARLLVAAGATLLALLPMFLVLHFGYAPLNWGELLLVTLPPTAFLALLGVLTGAISRNSAIALLLPVSYWIFEVSTRGLYTGPLFLFARTVQPACEDSIENCIAALATGPWLASKLWLIGAGLVLVLMTALLLQGGGRLRLSFRRTDAARRV